MPSNPFEIVRNTLMSLVLPLLLTALTGCCCYDPCGYNQACYNPCAGGGFYTSGMNYGSCVNDLPTLYGMQNGYCAPINCAPINTCSTVSRPPMVMRTYTPPAMGNQCMMGGCDVGGCDVGGCELGDCCGDYCDEGVIYETPEPTMGMPYGNYAYHERYHQHRHHHKVSWTQKVKDGWNKRFGKKPCDCPRCREKRRHFKNGEIHAMNCACPICRGEQFAMASSYEGEVIDGDVVYEDGQVYEGGDVMDGEMVDGEMVDGDVVYEDGEHQNGAHIVHPGHNPQTCPHCQKASGGMNRLQRTYDGEPVESQVIEDGSAHDHGMTQPYPEYGGQHFAPPVPARDGNGAKLNGQILEEATPAEVNPQPTFRQRPSTDDAPAPPSSAMPTHGNDDGFSQPQPIPDANISLKPPLHVGEEMSLPPTWEDAQTTRPTVVSKMTSAPQSLTPPEINMPAEHEWAQPVKPTPTSKGTNTAVYTKPATRSTMDERYRNAATKNTKPASHEQPILLPPAPEPRKLN